MNKHSPKIHELAVNAVCPINRDPTTPFEINMVKTLEEFGNQVAALFGPSERDAVLEEAAAVCDEYADETRNRGMEERGYLTYETEAVVNCQNELGRAIRALKNATPQESRPNGGAVAAGHAAPPAAAASDEEIIEKTAGLLREFIDKGMLVSQCYSSILAEIRACMRLARASSSAGAER